MVMRGRSEAGISVLEIMIALVVIAIALLAVTSLLFSSNRIQHDGKERMIAFNAARQVLEDMRAANYDHVWHRYNSIKADDITGVTNPGNTFKVPGLPPRKDGSDPGRIYFPEDSTGTNIVESPSNAALRTSLGMDSKDFNGIVGKDLNRDGDNADAFSNNAQFFILPIMIEVVWVTPGGRENRVEMASFLSK